MMKVPVMVVRFASVVESPFENLLVHLVGAKMMQTGASNILRQQLEMTGISVCLNCLTLEL
jgi:hypothetical protein